MHSGMGSIFQKGNVVIIIWLSEEASRPFCSWIQIFDFLGAEVALAGLVWVSIQFLSVVIPFNRSVLNWVWIHHNTDSRAASFACFRFSGRLIGSRCY